ncbi:hypothetical protein DPMN_031126 [Dreissena polymorpha]|uniref:Uncharacterized protein n=1 Tax=Dreissena polymorpha TaxID=45954 RepID=A0A9D4RIZ9_DREPO|nr:hypothetical protein DPMN_031126 [Dreissena polymorpha]
MKKAASSTNPIEYHHLTNLLQNGVIETGNPLQTRNLRDLLESTHQSVLEEKSENAKKALQTQTERRLLNVLRQIQ